MEKKKEKLLELTTKLAKDLDTATEKEFYDLCKDLYDMQDLVEEINNDKITQKFNGIYQDFIGEKTTTKDEVIEHLNIFKDVVEKAFNNENQNDLSDKLEKEKNEKVKIYSIIENYKYGIMCKDVKTVLESQIELIQYALSMPIENEKRINNVLEPLSQMFKEKDLSLFTEKEIELALDKVKELEKIIDEIKEKESKKHIPESKEEIKKEMDEILGESVFVGIEKIDFEHKDLDLETKNKIKKLQEEYEMYKLVENKAKIEEIREKIYFLAYPNLLPLKTLLTDKIVNLPDDKFERLNNLLVKYNNIVKKEKEETKNKKEDNSKKTDDKKPNNTSKKNKNKKRRKVISKKSAVSFYKRHKKGIHLTLGLALMAVGCATLLPTIMYLFSTFWGVAVSSGIPVTGTIPTLLHELNMIIGSKIGASYAASSGIWTMANGMALNATVAEAGILSTLGRLAVVATPFVGAKMVIKNAIKSAKEKIAKRKEKIAKENPERKGHFFKDIKDYVNKKYKVIKEGVVNKYHDAKETISTKYTETKQKVGDKYTEIKDGYEAKKDEKAKEKQEKIKNKTITSMLEEAYQLGLIDSEQFAKYYEADTNETFEFIKNGFKEEKGKGTK